MHKKLFPFWGSYNKYTQGHKVTTNDRPITQEPVKSSPWPHSIIAENSSLVRRKKPHEKVWRDIYHKGTEPAA